MNLFLVGLSHKTAPVSIREKLNFSDDHSSQYLEKLSKASIQSGIVLSTCNRVEIYANGSQNDLPLQLKKFIYDFHQVQNTSLDPYLYQKTDEEAVRHLFSVTSSLDSVVVGEPQILGQVKSAYDISKKFGLIDSFFELFLQKSFSIAKRVRNETDIGKLSVSISSMAVELSNKIFETLHGKSALILGAGEMAELALLNLKSKGIEKVWIANRTFETAAKIAKKSDAFPLYMEQFEDVLQYADIVITATGMSSYLIHPEMVVKSLERRKQQPQLFVDISVPRNVDPEVSSIANAYLYNIDDLQGMVEENQSLRMEAAKKAHEIINLETQSFIRELEQKNYSPTIQKLQKSVLNLMENEWKKSFPKIPAQEASQFIQSVQQKILSSSIRFLKEDDSKSFEEKVSTVEKVFDLDSED